MPRIAAANIAEHVAQQEQLVFSTAIGLFVERGYDAVSLADIAAEVGLKRNSLYRYFPSKAHILVAWFRRELPSRIERSAALLEGDAPPLERIIRWSDEQLDYAGRPEHTLVAAIGAIEVDLTAETRAELGASHARLIEPVRAALIEAGLDKESVGPTLDLLAGLILSAARSEARSGQRRIVREKVHRAIEALVG